MINFQIQDVRYSEKEDILLSVTKALFAIRQNIDKIPINTYYADNLKTKEKFKDIKYFNQSMDITVLIDLMNQVDEFFFLIDDETLNYIEIVTSSTAQSNDMDFDITQENIDNYTLGGEYSLYTKLGDTDYYYREL